MARLAWDGYGKAGIRLVKVSREGERHDLDDLTVAVQLQGAFETVHRDGDNRPVLPTDTMKNTVYALAREGPVAPPEAFAARLGAHFLEACPAAATAVVSVECHRWDRVAGGAGAHPHAFTRGAGERRLAVATVTRDGVAWEGGLAGLGLLKTTGSAFSGFLRDRYTTLRETRDRIFATEVEARWRLGGAPADWQAAFAAAREALIATFAAHASESVQQTLFAMGAAALAALPQMTEIRLLLPNQHHLVVDLSPFGLDNPNEVFVATREPYGRIEAVVTR